MARVEGIQDEQASLLQRFVFRTAARQTGAVPEPLRIMAHSGATMWAAGFFQTGFERARSVEPGLKTLACLKAASMIGCVF